MDPGPRRREGSVFRFYCPCLLGRRFGGGDCAFCNNVFSASIPSRRRRREVCGSGVVLNDFFRRWQSPDLRGDSSTVHPSSSIFGTDVVFQTRSATSRPQPITSSWF